MLPGGAFSSPYSESLSLPKGSVKSSAKCGNGLAWPFELGTNDATPIPASSSPMMPLRSPSPMNGQAKGFSFPPSAAREDESLALMDKRSVAWTYSERGCDNTLYNPELDAFEELGDHTASPGASFKATNN